MGFAERLLEVIDSGRRTATYKLAVLIALLDLCARHSDYRGQAPRLLYTRDIAEQVAGLYWPQVIPYLVPGSGSAVELRQITLPRAAIIAAVSEFRRAADAAGACPRGTWPASGYPITTRRCWIRSRSPSRSSALCAALAVTERH